MRRRSLGRAMVRTAAVGGVAYAAGSHSAKKSAQQQQMEAQQNAQIQELQNQQQQQPPQAVVQQPAAPVSTGMTQEKIDQLKQLGQLRESGILTDTEFEVQKSKLLNS